MGATSCRFKSCYPHQKYGDELRLVSIFFVSVTARRTCPTPTALVAGNVCRFAEQMTDFVRQGKLAVSLCETCSSASCYPHQQKTHFCLPTKVRFLNEARLWRMKNEAGLRPMKRAFGSRRSNIALRFIRAKIAEQFASAS